MNKQYLTAIAVVLVLVAILAIWPTPPLPPNTNPEPVPPVVQMSSTSTVMIGLHDTASLDGTIITPWAVLEDSRCPSDVQCIQAGRAVVGLNISTPSGSSTRELVLGESFTTETQQITFDALEPYPVSTRHPADSEYRFTFTATSATFKPFRKPR